LSILNPDNRLALLMHGAVTGYTGKMGFGLMRYGVAPTVVVIDRTQAGKTVREANGMPFDVPIVASVAEALSYNPDTIVPAIAPPGGGLPPEWLDEVKVALGAGMSLVNGLHKSLAEDPELQAALHPGKTIWDIRQEPKDIAAYGNGMGRARELRCNRVLFVGTDMANGKMTAAIEMDRAARARGIRSKFMATGQIGIAISGDGVPIDAVRIDFATGAVEQTVLRMGADCDILFVEGQGSLLHPASTATLALMRGSISTHLILSHRAGQETIARADWVHLPPLRKVIELNEAVCAAGGALPAAKVAGIAVNTAHLSEEEAAVAVRQIENETGLPATDVVRFGADVLLDAI
jgi:uncharacterized NAD-dependent epimerase/dehydratase family protein